MPTGAETLAAALAASGVSLVAANPGTSEMHLVAALGRQHQIRAVLGLDESVVTGIADGYGRVTRRPAATLLHLGPGLANGWSNLHNARRAQSPIVNIIGDHATYHLELDAPLTSDLVGLAQTIGWTRVVRSAETVAQDTLDAVMAAGHSPGALANLIVPADCAWSQATGTAQVTPATMELTSTDVDLRPAADALRTGERPALLLGGWALTGPALEHAGRIAARTGATLMAATFAPIVDHGAGAVRVERLGYFAEMAHARLAHFSHLVCVGTASPVAFFAYPDRPSELASGTVIELGHLDLDPLLLLAMLADDLDASSTEPIRHERSVLTAPDSGPIDHRTLAMAIAATLPDDAIVVDEGNTSAVGCLPASAGAPRSQWLQLTGGSIGFGLPAAAGAALGGGGRRVVALQSDGSAMYSLPALWTMAREQLDVTVVFLTNRRYGILQIELERTGAGDPGPSGRRLLSLDDPAIDAVSLGRGFGVRARRVDDAGALSEALSEAHATAGPTLIDVMVG